MYKLKLVSMLIAFSTVLSASEWISIENANQSLGNVRVENSDIYTTTLTFNIDGYQLVSVNGESGKIIRLDN